MLGMGKLWMSSYFQRQLCSTTRPVMLNFDFPLILWTTSTEKKRRTVRNVSGVEPLTQDTSTVSGRDVLKLRMKTCETVAPPGLAQQQVWHRHRQRWAGPPQEAATSPWVFCNGRHLIKALISLPIELRFGANEFMAPAS